VIRGALANLVEGLLLVLMVVLCVDVFLGVFSRYVLMRTFTWYDEIARLAFVWIVFLGAAVAVKRGAHFRLHLVVDRFPARARRAAEVLALLAIAGFGLLLVQQGLILVALGRFQQTPVMGLPKSYVYASIPAGGALIVLYALPHLRRALAR
jgi:TRAP-type C4-dicarboxylate transport system permease small subunit